MKNTVTRCTLLFIPIIILLLHGCYGGGDLEIKISGDYLYCSEGGDRTTINKQKPGHKGVSSRVILGTIRQYQSNSDFILVHREITDDSQKWYGKSELWNDQLGCKSQLWIIEVKKDIVHGPLDLVDYLNLKQELNVPTRLNLKL